MAKSAQKKQAGLYAELMLEKALAVERARRGLLNFTRWTKPNYQVNWHHRLMAAKLNQIVEGTLTRLIITLPPRHGKSELVSVRFPAFLLGRQPKAQVIAASYNATLAQKMNRQVQRVIDSPNYEALFPETLLNRSNVRTTSQGSWLRNSDEFEVVRHGGFYRSAGVGGSATGYGATCVIGSTKVKTERGDMPISEFFFSGNWPRVWGYDASDKKFRLCKVKAVQRKIASQLVTVTASDGSQVTCTPRHLFHTERNQGIPAEELGRLESGSKRRLCDWEMRPLQKACGEKGQHFFNADTQWFAARVLLKGLLGQGEAAVVRVASGEKMCGMWRYLSPAAQDFYVLQKNVCQPSTQPADANESKPLVFRREGQKGKLVDASGFHQSTTFDQKKGQAHLRDMPKSQMGKESACSSYRHGQEEQFIKQFDYPLRLVSFDGSQIAQPECQSVTTHSDEETEVFDIQVEGCKSFVANNLAIFNCGIIDDPVKNREEANSQTYRDRNWDWYTSTFYSRLEKNGAMIVCATRWHEDDLIGRLLQQAKENSRADQWDVLNLPAYAEDDQRHPQDFRQTGDALWPGKYDKEKLELIRNVQGERNWVSLYQQRPAPAEGQVVKNSWWRFWRELPKNVDYLCASADLNAKDRDTSDFTVVTVWARSGPNFYLVDMVRDRMGWIEQKRALQRVAAQYPDLNAIFIEDAANGIALIQEARSTVPGVVAVTPRGSKMTRLEAVSALIEAGNVFLPDVTMPGYEWSQKVQDELGVFPSGAHDDIVDSLSQALSQMRLKARNYSFDLDVLEKAPATRGLHDLTF